MSELYQKLRAIASSLWAKGGDNHRFVLSPSVFEVTQAQADDLERLGKAIYDCLGGMARIAAIAAQPSLCSCQDWRRIHRVLGMGVPSGFRGVQHYKPCRGVVPAIIKVDLMCGIDNRFWIAEIDAQNKHGMGYSALCARMRDVAVPDSVTFPSVVRAIVDEMKGYNTTRLGWFCPTSDRFYMPENQILRDELAKYGVELVIFDEFSVRFGDDGPFLPGGRPFTVLVDLPAVYHNTAVVVELSRRYLEGSVHFLIPPKPYLASKALLAMVCNVDQNPVLEAILLSQIDQISLDVVRRHLPKTMLVRQGTLEQCSALCTDVPMVLKETISFGMKGTTFSTDSDFDDALVRACRARDHYVLQEEVRNRPFSFAWFDLDGEARNGADWFTRVTVQYHRFQVADIIVTARQDKAVHGATDCLQLGTVIVPG